MASIQQPHIAFTSSSQTSADVSFQVSFAGFELGGFPQFAYSARIFFKVIRIVPQPVVAGTPPPPLPDPVILNIVTLSVPRPSSGNTTSHSTQFSYATTVNSNLITDHLLATVTLRRRRIFFPNMDAFNVRIDSKQTNDVVLTVSDLASPQPNGVIIP